MVSSTACAPLHSQPAGSRTDCRQRHHQPMVMIDIAVPRDIDPAVREVRRHSPFRHGRSRATWCSATPWDGRPPPKLRNKIVQAEVQGFRRKLMAERVVPTIVALRQRLDELCRQELEILRKEYGPFTEDQDQALTTLTNHITQRIAGSLARELKELPERDRTGRDDRRGQPPVPTGTAELAAAGAKN